MKKNIYLRALYGRDRYLVNVSLLTKENFLILNSIIIHPDISFNEIYMDYLYGIDKILYLFIKKIIRFLNLKFQKIEKMSLC